MSWTTALSDLRTNLSDNVSDKHQFRKKVFGEFNGTNVFFKTLEFRRITNFTDDPPTTAALIGVWLNGEKLDKTDIANDYVETGDFELKDAPANGDTLEASYYIQWFTDAELGQFLRLAMNWLAKGDDYSQLESGLRPAALDYAMGEAYLKLALMWSRRISETYLLEDSVQKERYALVDMYAKWGDSLKEKAENSVKFFYSRAGQNEVPAFNSLFGRVRDVVPKR